MLTIIPAPYFKKYGKLPGVIAFVDEITAAVIGAIASAVVVLAKRSIVDLPTALIVLIALVTVALLWRFKKLQESVIIAAAATIGWFFIPC